MVDGRDVALQTFLLYHRLRCAPASPRSSSRSPSRLRHIARESGDTDRRRWYPVVRGAPVAFDDLPPARDNVEHGAPFGGGVGAPPALDATDIAAIVAFLRALTDADIDGAQRASRGPRSLFRDSVRLRLRRSRRLDRRRLLREQHDGAARVGEVVIRRDRS